MKPVINIDYSNFSSIGFPFRSQGVSNVVSSFYNAPNNDMVIFSGSLLTTTDIALECLLQQQGRILVESQIYAAPEYKGSPDVHPSFFPSSSLFFQTSKDKQTWTTNGIFADFSKYGLNRSKKNEIFTFFSEEPYYFRIALLSPLSEGDIWGLSNIKVWSYAEHRKVENKLATFGRVERTNNFGLTASISRDNGFIQHQIPRTETGYKWITGSLSLTSSISGTYPVFNVKHSKINQKQWYDYYSATSQSFFWNTKPIASGSGLLNVNLATNTIELSSSYSSSVLTGSSRPFITWRQIRVGENIIARKLKENNIISVALPPQQSNFLSNTNQNIVNIAKRNDVVNYKEPVVSDKNKPLKFRFIFKGNNNPHLAHEVKISYDNIVNTFANKGLKKRLGIVEKQPETYKVIKNWLYNPNLPENENPIAKFLGYSIGEKIFPKDVNTGLKETKARTKYLLNVPGFDRDGYDRQLGTQRVFWRDDPNNRIRSYSGSITSLGDFDGLLNLTGTVINGAIARSSYAARNPAKGIIWQFTSSWSGTFSSSYGNRSILPLGQCNNLQLLFTSSFTARNDRAFNENDGNPYDGQVQNLTQSMRTNIFIDSGELNISSFIDYFTTGTGISIFGNNIDENSLKETCLPLQLIRNTEFSLYNMFAMFGSGSGLAR